MAGSSSAVRALMSLTTSLSSPGGAPCMKEEQISTAEAILELNGLRGEVRECAGE